MKIIEPSVELIDDVNAAAIYSKIERCGRVSRQSKPIVIKEGEFSQEDIGKISTDIQSLKTMEQSSVQFVRKLIKRGHESVLEHVSLTFHIICDRAIMAELTRHRLASFTVESTRYCKYDELTAINQFPNDAMGEFIQEESVLTAESIYRDWIKNHGATPEQARAVLPLCTKTELYMTANLRELRHILSLRCAKAAHPQMREIALEMLTILYQKLPVVFEDIWELYQNECK